MEKLKKSWYLIAITLATGILGVIAVVTALKLYQIGQQPVAPTAPQKVPAQEATPQPACKLSFSVATPTPTPTPTPVPKCWDTCQTNDDCPGNLVCQTSGTVKRCANKNCSTEQDCVCATPTPTPSVTPTPTPSATPTPTPSVTPGPSGTPGPTPTPTTPSLPQAGLSTPTLGVFAGGVLLILVGLILAI